jgi:hypothetical protein
MPTRPKLTNNDYPLLSLRAARELLDSNSVTIDHLALPTDVRMKVADLEKP